MTRPAYKIPQALETCLQAAVGHVGVKPLAVSVGELSSLFTKHRARRAKDYFSTREFRVAYLAYFLPANYNKLQAVFDEMRPLLTPQLQAEQDEEEGRVRSFRVLDLGAGPGTMTLAALEYLHSLQPTRFLEFFAVDPSRQMWKVCNQLFNCFRDQLGIGEDRVHLKAVVSSMETLIRRSLLDSAINVPLDLIIVGNAWNEFVEGANTALDAQVKIIENLLGWLDDHGALILIEPALRETSRRLHRLHDAVLRQIPTATIFAPCVHQQACPCVLEGNEKDWCHTEYPWVPSPEIAAIDRRIGNRKDALKFSYLVLRKDGRNVLDLRRPPVASQEKSACWRVVSELIQEKGKRRAFLCGPSGRIQFTQLDRHQGVSSKPFVSLARGDLVKISGELQRAGERRVQRDTGVEMI